MEALKTFITEKMKIINIIRIELIKSKSIYHLIAFLYLMLVCSLNFGSWFEIQYLKSFEDSLRALNKDILYSFFFIAIVHFSTDIKTGGIISFRIEGKKTLSWILIKINWLFFLGITLYSFVIFLSVIVFKYLHTEIIILADKFFIQNILLFPIILLMVIVYSCLISMLFKNIVVSLLFFVFYPIIESLIAMGLTLISMFINPKFAIYVLNYLPYNNLMNSIENNFLSFSFVNNSILITLFYLLFCALCIFIKNRKFHYL